MEISFGNTLLRQNIQMTSSNPAATGNICSGKENYTKTATTQSLSMELFCALLILCFCTKNFPKETE